MMWVFDEKTKTYKPNISFKEKKQKTKKKSSRKMITKTIKELKESIKDLPDDLELFSYYETMEIGSFICEFKKKGNTFILISSFNSEPRIPQ